MWAIVLSLTLHALALGALVPAVSGETGDIAPAERLHAVLRAVSAAPINAAVPAVAVPINTAVAAVAVPPAPTFNQPSRRQMAVAPSEQLARAVSPAPTYIETFVPAAQGGESVQRATSETATAALAAPTEARGPDAAGLRQYRISLAGEAKRYRNYPEVARRAGVTGTAEVRVTVAAAGATRHAELARSSGHAVLDAAALEMLRQAVARTLLPESLRGQEFAVLLPVVFEVED